VRKTSEMMTNKPKQTTHTYIPEGRKHGVKFVKYSGRSEHHAVRAVN
jgi:hypothetical protein